MKNNWDKEIEEVLSKGIPLNDFGINNWGFTKEKCLLSINKLSELSIPVLGGDVLKLDNGEWTHTYDNWHCDKSSDESDEDFVIRSNQVANEYISKYPINKNTEILFVLVPKGV